MPETVAARTEAQGALTDYLMRSNWRASSAIVGGIG